MTKFFTQKYLGIILLLCTFSFSTQAQLITRHSKVSQDLLDIENKLTQQLTGTKDLRLQSAAPLQIIGSNIVVEFIAENDPKVLANDLKKIGAKKISVFGRMVACIFPVDSLGDLEYLPSLRFARPAYKPYTQVGSTTSQGDVAQGSDLARVDFGIDGTGIKVGILSDSYDTLEGEADGIASGDLPGEGNPEGYTTPVENLFDLGINEGSDEGRAMAEIVHDVAPGAALAFNTAFLGQAGFAQGILDLANVADCDVIVDDIIYFAEPMFQDGIIGQAVDQVSAQGVTYLSSAGNNLRSSYESEFRDGGEFVLKTTGGEDLGAYQLHDFDPSDEEVDVFQRVTLTTDGNLQYALQWDSPFASVCPTCPGSPNDVDIFLALEEDPESVVLFSADDNLGQDPFELLSASYSGIEPLDVYIIIGKRITEEETPMPGLIKYVSFGDDFDVEHFTFSATCFGHANAKTAIAVGAVRYDSSPAYGVNPPLLEVFSSAGGTPTFFDAEGNRITTEVRQKPEICAPQGANTTFFGFDYEGDGFPNFFGTSSSAPHAAGVVALMLEKKNGLTPKVVRDILMETSIDMDDPATAGFDTGFDFGSGFGYIQAVEAIQAVQDLPGMASFTLVNADDHTLLGELKDGDKLLLSDLPTNNLNILVTTFPEEVGSVKLSLTGTREHTQVENYLPYAAFGDIFGTDKFRGKILDFGDYTLEATLYSEKNNQGEVLATQTISFELITSIESFTLVNADTDQSIEELTDGATISMANTGNELNVKADINGVAGSVRFVLQDGDTQEILIDRVENIAPYTMVGNSGNDYKIWVPSAGEYVLTATPYSGLDASGNTATPLQITFTVAGEVIDIAAWPNPFNNEVSVSLPDAGTYSLILKNHLGENVYTTEAKAKEGQSARVDLNSLNLKEGIYYIEVVGENTKEVLRIVKK